MAASVAVLAVAVFFVTVWDDVNGQTGTCREIDFCSQKFVQNTAYVRHDPELMCQKSNEQVQCMQGAYFSCTPEEKPYAQTRIDVAKQEHDRQCDACLALASLWLVCISAVLSTLYNHWL